MHRFFLPDLIMDVAEFHLPEDESKHACRVLRLKTGDSIEVVNGNGLLVIGEIIDDHVKKTRIKVIESYLEAKEKQHIHIAIAPTKNMDRFEWFLEKATEIGVDEITPLLTANAERKVIKMERLEKVIISATKQSKRLFKPLLNPMTTFNDFLNTTSEAFIAHCEDMDNKNNLNVAEINDNFTLLIGPEGDFSVNEIQHALKKGYKPVSLGANRLRTETAGVYAVTVAKILHS